MAKRLVQGPAEPVWLVGADGEPIDAAHPLDVSDAGAVSGAAVLGTVADAAIITDTTGTISGKLRGLVALIVNLLSRWPAALGAGGGLKVDGSGTALPVSGAVTVSGTATTTAAASEAHVGEVGGRGIVVAATFARPNNTTAYASKDAVSDSTSSPTVLSFPNIARVNAGTGYIVKARIQTNQSTSVARFRVHLFNVAPTAINDNAAWTLLWANRAARIGYVDFDGCQTEGAGSDCANAMNATVRLHFATAPGTRALYGLLETLDAFTPAALQSFYIELNAEVD